MADGVRLGIADHLGWAVVVSATADHTVVDRRRIALIEPGTAAAPIHHEGKGLDDDAAAELVADVRASAAHATVAAFDGLAAELPGPVVSMSLRALPTNLPGDLSALRRPPWEARADAVMYREVLANLARTRDWELHFFDARNVVDRASGVLGDRAEAVLWGPRAELGPPWNADHRMALAATVVAV